MDHFKLAERKLTGLKKWWCDGLDENGELLWHRNVQDEVELWHQWMELNELYHTGFSSETWWQK